MKQSRREFISTITVAGTAIPFEANMESLLEVPAPLTLHVEYPLFEKGEEKLTLIQQKEIIVRKLKKDVDFINSYLKNYQLFDIPVSAF
jgi:hypothetical protein